MGATRGSSGQAPISEDDDLLYRTCLENGPLSVSDLAEHLQWATPTVERRLGELRRLGLVGHGDGLVHALPPRAPLHGLAADLESAAVEARRRAVAWAQMWHQYRERAPYLEVLETDESAAAADDGVVRSAQRQVRGLQVGPIWAGTKRPAHKVADGFFEAAERGVRFRVVYGIDILRDPQGLAAVQACVAAGEEARVFPDVPLNLSIADDRLAVITVPGDTENRRNAVVVHPSGLLEALTSVFESYWRMAVPVSAEGPTGEREPPDRHTRRLLAYLGAGLTDESIARELGVSERTVGRRIARLQELLGASSRFQLGSQATRRGWI
ncbi:MAG TPA: HTH domain-containing protein [Segeticoccus sp.]|jgi:DNA-binding CsgD family transcriptional regulator|nr:HTH domain-containing protein [Segeticoccus sp.]